MGTKEARQEKEKRQDCYASLSTATRGQRKLPLRSEGSAQGVAEVIDGSGAYALAKFWRTYKGRCARATMMRDARAAHTAEEQAGCVV